MADITGQEDIVRIHDDSSFTRQVSLHEISHDIDIFGLCRCIYHTEFILMVKCACYIAAANPTNYLENVRKHHWGLI